MTQIKNVMYIVLITLTMSIIATVLTFMFDNSFDVKSLVKSIPHLILNNFSQI